MVTIRKNSEGDWLLSGAGPQNELKNKYLYVKNFLPAARFVPFRNYRLLKHKIVG
jgi:hypothetical protein